MRTGVGDGAAVFVRGKSNAALSSAASLHGWQGRGGPSDSQRAQANTDLQWKALGSRSRLPGGCSARTGSIPAFEVLFTLAGIRTSRSFGVRPGSDTVKFVQGGWL